MGKKEAGVDPKEFGDAAFTKKKLGARDRIGKLQWITDRGRRLKKERTEGRY